MAILEEILRNIFGEARESCPEMVQALAADPCQACLCIPQVLGSLCVLHSGNYYHDHHHICAWDFNTCSEFNLSILCLFDNKRSRIWKLYGAQCY